MSASAYELERQRNIASNKAILASLGLEKPLPAPKRAPSKPKSRKPRTADAASKKSSRPKRKIEDVDTDAAEGEDGENGGNKRRSRRLLAKDKPDYRKTHIITSIESDDDDKAFINDASSDEEGGYSSTRYTHASAPGFLTAVVSGRTVRKYASSGPARARGKYYGAPPGIPVGKWWAQRSECARDDVHGPWVAGIHGDPEEGAYSVALSGGYEDDVDEGFRFTFTGEGGRDLKGTRNKPKNLRTGPQCKDQTLTRGNAALAKSVETGRPVRVVRGYKGHSEWAPREGYRYDGLYKVVRMWEEKGLAGFKVYKFAFMRIDGQEPIRLDVNGPPEDEDDEAEDSEELAEDTEEEEAGRQLKAEGKVEVKEEEEEEEEDGV